MTQAAGDKEWCIQSKALAFFVVTQAAGDKEQIFLQMYGNFVYSRYMNSRIRYSCSSTENA
jgi:hypothetical protein